MKANTQVIEDLPYPGLVRDPEERGRPSQATSPVSERALLASPVSAALRQIRIPWPQRTSFGREPTPRSRGAWRGGRPSGLDFPLVPRVLGREGRAPQQGWSGCEAISGDWTPAHRTPPQAGYGHAPREMRAGGRVAASGPTPRQPRHGEDCRPVLRCPKAASSRDHVPGPNTQRLPASLEPGEPSRRKRTRPTHGLAGDDCAN